MAAVVPVITSAFGGGASVLGTALTVGGTIASGIAANRQGKQQQLNLNAQAKQAEAVSQREAINRRREGALLASRQRAIAAAQGGGADPSVLALLGDTAAETERSAATEIYRGTTQASGLRASGAAARAQGRAALTGSIIGGAAQGLKGISGAFDRFGEIDTTPATTPTSYRYG